MQNQEIKEYINARYNRWADYSLFHATNQGLTDQHIDILNEVLEAVLKKDEDYLIKLYGQKKNGYTGLDYMVLSMLKMYCTSPNAPYRWKYSNRMLIDANADYRRIEIIEEPDADTDRAGETAFEMNLVRWIFERLELNDLEYCTFQYRFYEDQSIADLSVLCDKKTLYDAYNIVARSMYEILKLQGLTKARPKTKNYNAKRVEIIVKAFEKNHLQAFQAEIEKLRYILEQEY